MDFFVLLGVMVPLMVACAGGLLVLGLVALALVKRFRSAPQAHGLPSPVAFVRTTQSRLRDWSPQALERMAARWRGEWAHGLGQVGTFLGEVLDTDEPEGPGWLALGIHRPSPGTTRLWMCHARSCWHVVFHHNVLTMAGQGEVRVDDRVLGYLQLPAGVHTQGTVTLLDTDRRPVGRYRRRGRVWATVGRLSTFSDRGSLAGQLTLFYGPVVLRERFVGRLVGTWVRVPTPAQRQRLGRPYGPALDPYPAFRHLQEGLTEEDRTWLLTLVALELALDAAMMDTKRVQDGGTRALVQRVTFEDIGF